VCSDTTCTELERMLDTLGVLKSYCVKLWMPHKRAITPAHASGHVWLSWSSLLEDIKEETAD